MNLKLSYPEKEPFSFSDLKILPNKSGAPSGYFMIAMAESYMKTLADSFITVDRYVCFCNYERDQVWIEKLAVTRPRQWLAFEDTIRIEDDDEFNSVHDFLLEKGILDGKKRT